ncbi:hypothetical protein BJ875DRAFT_438470 [Amylocarpus encephaloides]|uniref:Uncharacterized protein n=1 Tax=Amylocarpus encephaloides TaxID=45428 RepID=A0A9P7YPG2_9HELO|nr:hypothetical protein BJ875DRAFT_438470 [Amylocarpus encephaloides]
MDEVQLESYRGGATRSTEYSDREAGEDVVAGHENESIQSSRTALLSRLVLPSPSSRLRVAIKNLGIGLSLPTYRTTSGPYLRNHALDSAGPPSLVPRQGLAARRPCFITTTSQGDGEGPIATLILISEERRKGERCLWECLPWRIIPTTGCLRRRDPVWIFHVWLLGAPLWLCEITRDVGRRLERDSCSDCGGEHSSALSMMKSRNLTLTDSPTPTHRAEDQTTFPTAEWNQGGSGLRSMLPHTRERLDSTRCLTPETVRHLVPYLYDVDVVSAAAGDGGSSQRHETDLLGVVEREGASAGACLDLKSTAPSFFVPRRERTNVTDISRGGQRAEIRRELECARPHEEEEEEADGGGGCGGRGAWEASEFDIASRAMTNVALCLATGPLVLWSGPLVLSEGPLVFWSSGRLVPWPSGPLVLW